MSRPIFQQEITNAFIKIVEEWFLKTSYKDFEELLKTRKFDYRILELVSFKFKNFFY